MRPRSLLGQISLLQQGLMGLQVIAFAVLAIAISAATLARQETTYLTHTARQVAEGLDREWLERKTLARAAAEVIEETAPTDVWIQVIDSTGHTVASTVTGVRPQSRSDRREVRAALRRGASVVVYASTRWRHKAIEALILALVLAAVPLLLVGTLASRTLARRALAPLARLTAEADAATAVTVPRILTVESDPTEIVTLSSAFDRLLAQVSGMLVAERHFSQDAAHELRTPLTVISGELELALSNADLPARHRHGLEQASGQVRGMSALVDALLMLRQTSHWEAGRAESMTRVDLGRLVQCVLEEAGEPLHDRKLAVLVDSHAEIVAKGNASLLTSAVRNLVMNAVKFTLPGQAIRVALRSDPAAACVIVEDGGSGIPPADRDRVFEPFFRGGEARANQDGVGLGLAIARRVARAHGGEIVLGESPLGGARFELRLPRISPGD